MNIYLFFFSRRPLCTLRLCVRRNIICARGEIQCEPGIDAEGNDEERLHGVDDEDEVESMLVGDALKDEHGLDGEVPRAGTVRRRHNDCDRTDDECDEGAT